MHSLIIKERAAISSRRIEIVTRWKVCTLRGICFFPLFRIYVYVQPFGLWQKLSWRTWSSLCGPLFSHLCFISQLWLTATVRLSPPNFIPATWLFLRSHSNSNSLSLAPSLPLTFVVFKNLSPIAFLFTSESASHRLSASACHLMPSICSSLTSFLLFSFI